MSTMAVVTLGSRFITQLGNFTVESFEIGTGDIFMTPAALVDDFKLEIGHVGTFDSMSLMTVIAVGLYFFSFMGCLAVDAFTELLVNTTMTIGTCQGNIIAVYG